MAYFSNGTEGMAYEEAYCSKCLHYGDCAVWDAHMLKNYDECNNKESILHILIPMEGVGQPGKCNMFIDNGKPHDNYELNLGDVNE